MAVKKKRGVVAIVKKISQKRVNIDEGDHMERAGMFIGKMVSDHYL